MRFYKILLIILVMSVVIVTFQSGFIVDDRSLKRYFPKLFEENMLEKYETLMNSSIIQPPPGESESDEASAPIELGQGDEDFDNGQYVLLFSIAEQINQALRGIKQVLRLAKETNRTFVIPRVYGSRVRPPFHPRAFSMSRYFDTSALRSYHPHIIEFETFLKSGKPVAILKFDDPQSTSTHKKCESMAIKRWEKYLREFNLQVLTARCFTHGARHWIMDTLSSSLVPAFAFAPYDKHIWTEAGVPEFEISPYLMTEVDRFKRTHFRGAPYISIQWRMERTKIKNGNPILQSIIEETKKYLATHPNVTRILLSTDLSFSFGSKTLDTNEYTQWLPYFRRLVRELPIKPVMYDPSNAKIQLDSGMVGLIEQELHVDAELFIPGMVQSGFVKTILRKRELKKRPYKILLDEDRRIWNNDLRHYRAEGIL